MGYKLWASANAAPLIICPAAGKTSDSSDPKFANKVDFDWDYGVRFKRLTELADAMRKYPGKCSRLAIMAHGSGGLIDIESVASSAIPTTRDMHNKALEEGALTALTISKFTGALTQINGMLEAGAYVLFMSCNMAYGREGAQLLLALSSVLSNANIVGFTRIGTSYQMQSVEKCDMPGMKVGDYVAPAGSEQREYDRRQALINAPFASETNPFAKVARNGKLTKDPEPETDPNYKLDPSHYVSKLIGVWDFEIGDFKGYVGFEGSVADGKGKAWWSSAERIGFRHNGSWTATAGTEITFSFDDDTPGLKRLFRVNIDGPISQGDIKVGGVLHGLFKLIDMR